MGQTSAKIFLCAILFFASLCAHAQQDIYSVKYAAASFEVGAASKEASRIASNMQRSHFVDLTESMTPFRRRVGVDQIFTSENLERTVLITYGLVPLHEKKPGLVYRDEEGNYLVHGKTEAGLAFAAFFIGYSRLDLNPIMKDLEYNDRGISKSKKSVLRELFFADALARPVFPPCGPPRSWSEDADALATSIKNHAGTCALNALFGGLSVFGKGWSTLLNVGAAGLSAASSDSSFWERAKDSWNASKRLITDFQKVMHEKYQGFFRLKEEKQAELFCAFAASAATTVGAAAAITAGTGGTAAPLAFLAVNSVLSQLETSSDLAEDLKKIRCQPQDDVESPNGGSGSSQINR